MELFEFDEILIEKYFSQAEQFLLNINNVYKVKYENFDITTFDKLNSEMLKSISNNFIVYCLWQGPSYANLTPKYIGHAKHTISRQRMRAHLTKKNKATGAQLEKIIKGLDEKCYFGLTYLIIKPSYMRTSLEEWLINKNVEILDWNKNK